MNEGAIAEDAGNGIVAIDWIWYASNIFWCSVISTWPISKIQKVLES